jgi:hypothetical protein
MLQRIGVALAAIALLRPVVVRSLQRKPRRPEFRNIWKVATKGGDLPAG